MNMNTESVQGVINFHFELKIDMEEFRSWAPDRIDSFFSGLAQALAARYDNPTPKSVSKLSVQPLTPSKPQ